MRLPLELVRSGEGFQPTPGETKNLSSGGVLFSYEGQVNPGEPIEYLITLPNSTRGTVQLRCVGKVLRTEGADNQSQVAATLERYEFVRSGA